MAVQIPDYLIGPYRIEREIGTGGMGTVYLAARADRQFEKRVALKIMRSELNAEFALSRFRNERQILANLEHPNIARLLDGGTSADGRPYLVMELVEGLRLNEYCRDQPLRARLNLFRKICLAVQHAHEHLVIHRDLKPGNILVEADGEPKLLDFGIAKLIDPENAGGQDQTQTLPLLLTPAYASPEQLAGEPATTASDVFALGVLLYEVLTDRLPFLSGRAPDREPEPPSRYHKQLAGDLDNIVLMALRSEPERRYRSAAELAGDIQRYTENLPVRAHPDTVSYLAAKFIARHRLAAAATVIALLSMVVLILLLSAQVRRANRQRLRAERISAYMQEILGGGPQNRPGTSSARDGRDLKVVDVLGAAANDLASALKDQPAERAELRSTIGLTFSRLGQLDAADRQLRTALRTQASLFGENGLPLAETLHDLGSNERYQGRFAVAAEDLRRSAVIFHRYRDPAEADAANDLAVTLFDEGHYKEAGVLLERLLEARRASHRANDVDLIVLMNNVAVVRFNNGDFAGASQLQREVVDAHRKRDPAGSPSMELGYSEVNLGNYLRLSGNAAAAEPVALASVDALRTRLGDSHWMTAYAEVELAKVYSEEGKHSLAEQEARKALAILTKVLPPGHPEFTHAWIALGSILTAEGKPDQGEPYLRRAFARRQTLYPKGSQRVAQAADALAICLIARKSFAAARPFAEMAYAGFKASYGEHNRLTRGALLRLKSIQTASRP
ncbi:MAG TPA: serine/threonine-protein kinase [Bryobacteraceae bacterium]|nr:serine/threonine-protein kinase [Bryobacteraceae bacterium]